MKNIIHIFLLSSALSGTSARAELMAYYGSGTEVDAAALLNLAPTIANVTVSDLSDLGAQTGDTERITRPAFSTDTPAGPTANSAVGSEWFEARSTENQGDPGTTDNYFFFTATAADGFLIDLASLKYDFWVSDAGGGATTAAAEGFVSVNGGEFVSFGSITATDNLGVGVSAPVASADLDLSSIKGAQSVEIRIGIGYSEGNAFSISGFMQGIQLEGAIVPNTFPLVITQNETNPANYDFVWESKDGFLYDLVSSTDLASPISNWAVWEGNEDIDGTAPENSLSNIPGGSDAKRFFAMVEKTPPPLLEEDFDLDDGGFTAPLIAGVTEGTLWEWGTADSDNSFGVTVSGSCWAVGLGSWDGGNGDAGFYGTSNASNPTTTYLRSTPIDLSGLAGAELSFSEAIDAEDGDVAEVYLIDANDAIIGEGPIHTATLSGMSTSYSWAAANGGTPIALPAAAMEQTVRIEWRFTGSGTDYLGWYIDDVVVRQTTP
ncbi:hypothetical protein AAFN60_06465 [Roseibacillus persicicus]|uniref:hypothetical protein n=1 Tax=Roseibacillus persicicus TaxID=454148 RepID=UPI00398BA101